jgi:hypothetical protein
MHHRIIVSILAVLLVTAAASTHQDLTLLKAIYTPANDSDREYGQGAIERNELAHREIERNIWLIRVPDEAGPAAWQQRLNESVAREHGSFRVVVASEDERKRVESGEITLQQ